MPGDGACVRDSGRIRTASLAAHPETESVLSSPPSRPAAWEPERHVRERRTHRRRVPARPRRRDLRRPCPLRRPRRFRRPADGDSPLGQPAVDRRQPPSSAVFSPPVFACDPQGSRTTHGTRPRTPARVGDRRHARYSRCDQSRAGLPAHRHQDHRRRLLRNRNRTRGRSVGREGTGRTPEIEGGFSGSTQVEWMRPPNWRRTSHPRSSPSLGYSYTRREVDLKSDRRTSPARALGFSAIRLVRRSSAGPALQGWRAARLPARFRLTAPAPTGRVSSDSQRQFRLLIW